MKFDQILKQLQNVEIGEGDNKQTIDLSQVQAVVDALRAAQDSASANERSRLQSSVDYHKEQVNSLRNQIETLSQQMASAAATNTATTTGSPTPQPSNQAPAQATASNGSQSTGAKSDQDFSAVMEQFKNLLKDNLTPLQQELANIKAESVSAYRERRMKELEKNKVPFIAEIVVGDTKEEVDAALNRAKDLALKYGLKPEGSPSPAPQPPANPGGAQPPAPNPAPSATYTPQPPATPPVAPPAAPSRPANPSGSGGGSDIVTRVAGMDDKEYAAQREQLLSNLKNLVPGQ